MNRLPLITALLATVGYCAQASADIITVTDAQVLRTMTTSDTTYGGCMAALSIAPGNVCTGKWVTFSCSGNFTDKDRGYRMFDQAQLAYTLGKRVMVQVDTARKHNGYCFATRIDVYN